MVRAVLLSTNHIFLSLAYQIHGKQSSCISHAPDRAILRDRMTAPHVETRCRLFIFEVHTNDI